MIITKNYEHNGILPYDVDVGVTFIVCVMDFVNKSNVNESYSIGLAIQS